MCYYINDNIITKELLWTSSVILLMLCGLSNQLPEYHGSTFFQPAPLLGKPCIDIRFLYACALVLELFCGPSCRRAVTLSPSFMGQDSLVRLWSAYGGSSRFESSLL